MEKRNRLINPLAPIVGCDRRRRTAYTIPLLDDPGGGPKLLAVVGSLSPHVKSGTLRFGEMTARHSNHSAELNCCGCVASSACRA